MGTLKARTPYGWRGLIPSPRVRPKTMPRYSVTARLVALPHFAKRLVVIPAHRLRRTARGTPHPVVGINSTGMIFFGVDHLKHPLRFNAERRSRPYLCPYIGERERRSESHVGRWWWHDVGPGGLRYVWCGCDAPDSIYGAVGRMG